MKIGQRPIDHAASRQSQDARFAIHHSPSSIFVPGYSESVFHLCSSGGLKSALNSPQFSSTYVSLRQAMSTYVNHPPSFFSANFVSAIRNPDQKIKNAYSAEFLFRSRSKVFQGVPNRSKPFFETIFFLRGARRPIRRSQTAATEQGGRPQRPARGPSPFESFEPFAVQYLRPSAKSAVVPPLCAATHVSGGSISPSVFIRVHPWLKSIQKSRESHRNPTVSHQKIPVVFTTSRLFFFCALAFKIPLPRAALRCHAEFFIDALRGDDTLVIRFVLTRLLFRIF